MVHASSLLYKGDVLASWFYMGVGGVLLCTAVLLQVFQVSLGFLYLSFGLGAFSLYCLGKGIFMWIIYRKRHLYFNMKSKLTVKDKSEEIIYTEKRIMGKQQGRRMHVYTIILGSIIAFIGVFTSEKGLILGSCIPVVLLSGIEFSVGLLTEFRLHEYLRILSKNNTEGTENPGKNID